MRVTTVQELLELYESPAEAARVAGRGRTAGYHWYGERSVVPSDRSLMAMANHSRLKAGEVTLVLLDAIRCRMSKAIDAESHRD